MASVMIYLNVKVCKLVWKSEVIIPLMIFLTLVFDGILFALIAFTLATPQVEFSSCTNYIFTALPVTMFAIGVILNINKWIYF